MANLQAFYNSDLIEAGCDEAGRGCLSGPVVAASVVLPKDFKHPMLDDSKKLTEKKKKNFRAIHKRKCYFLPGWNCF